LNKNQQNVLKFFLKKIDKPKSLTSDEVLQILSEIIVKIDIPDTWSKNDSNLLFKKIKEIFKKYDK
jgi:hypothetical protein